MTPQEAICGSKAGKGALACMTPQEAICGSEAGEGGRRTQVFRRRSDVLPKGKTLDRKVRDLRSETGKVSAKRDEKLDGDQPVVLGP
jgi:hypothetical protein